MRQDELEEVQLGRNQIKQIQKFIVLKSATISDMTQLWLSRQKSKAVKEEKEGNNRKIGTRSVTEKTKIRKTKHKRYIKTFETGHKMRRRGIINQFKQLLDQTLRFMRAASSPVARMAQMSSNRRYKPGDRKEEKDKINKMKNVLVAHKYG